MIHFNDIDKQTFLNEYWQKKPYVFRQALPHFDNPLSPDELAGLALEEEVESRMVFETPDIAPFWHLKRGPFSESDFLSCPKTHWTLLVQGVDRLLPEVMVLLKHFDFIPAWRVDDVMISYAVEQGSVGPHYDNYDVFLFQASGRRQWSLTTKECHQNNYLDHVDLRIMAQFEVEEEYILEPGDMLYLPPHVGHHGMSLDDDCMTYSFGYRSYFAKELWNDFGDFLAEHDVAGAMYCDPSWVKSSHPADITFEAREAAIQSMQSLLNDERQLKVWFGCFVTRPDRAAEQQMPQPLEDDECTDLSDFMNELSQSNGLIRDGTCRMAVMDDGDYLFINGILWQTENVSKALILYVAHDRELFVQELMPLVRCVDDQLFLYEFWKLQWLQWRQE